jgi:hypothetical protein
VLDVEPAAGQDLEAIVDWLDPAGTAMAVDAFSDFGNHDRRTLAVDPARFAQVAGARRPPVSPTVDRASTHRKPSWPAHRESRRSCFLATQ